MKKEIRGFIAGILVAGVVAGSVGTASAVVGRLQANLDYNNIKISLNGQTVTPKDANGNTVEPFAINGTTYLPVEGFGRRTWAGCTVELRNIYRDSIWYYRRWVDDKRRSG